MSSRSHFSSDVSHAIDLKAVEVIARVSSKKSGRKNHRWRRRIKKNDVPNNSRHHFAAIKLFFYEDNCYSHLTTLPCQAGITKPPLNNLFGIRKSSTKFSPTSTHKSLQKCLSPHRVSALYPYPSNAVSERKLFIFEF